MSLQGGTRGQVTISALRWTPFMTPVPGAGTGGSFFCVLLLVLTACQGGGRDTPATRAAAIALTDDAGHAVTLNGPAQRIVSLVPSVTEAILALGAGNRLVGRTEYDKDPALASVPLVGRGLSPSVEAIVALRPDLVITWSSDRRGDLRACSIARGSPPTRSMCRTRRMHFV